MKNSTSPRCCWNNPLALRRWHLYMGRCNLWCTVHQISFAAPSDEMLQQVSRDITREGIGILENFLSSAALSQLQNFIKATTVNAQHDYLSLSGDALAATALGQLSNSREFVKMMRFLYSRGSGLRAPEQPIYPVLRCLAGKSGLKHSLRCHYDTHFVTALLPIIIPGDGAAGNLVVARRQRDLRGSYLRSLFDKILVQNPISRSFFRKINQHKNNVFSEVRLIPGHLYLFYGYKRIHGNTPCDPNKIRATALFHFGDPHEANPLQRFVRMRKADHSLRRPESTNIFPALHPSAFGRQAGHAWDGSDVLRHAGNFATISHV